MYRILVVGGGYVGTAVAEYFRSKNQRVWVTTRSKDKAERFRQCGVQAIVCDLTRPETIREVPDVQFVVIAVAPDSRDELSYRQIYIDGVRNILSPFKQKLSLPFVVYISSTGVYPDVSGDWVDENTHITPDSERSKILCEAEEQVLKSGLQSVVFRLGGIYGPERNQIQNLKSGKWPEPAPDDYVNLIHLEDVVGGVLTILKKSEAGQIYNGVDDEPVRRSEIFEWLSNQLKIENQAKLDKKTVGGKRCRNQKLKDLEFRFKYPNFKTGYESLLK